MQAREAWRKVSEAFNDLESLAEACEDNRLDNYPDLQAAFDAVDRAIAEAEHRRAGGNREEGRMEHTAEYHEQYEAEHLHECPECEPWCTVNHGTEG